MGRHVRVACSSWAKATACWKLGGPLTPNSLVCCVQAQELYLANSSSRGGCKDERQYMKVKHGDTYTLQRKLFKDGTLAEMYLLYCATEEGVLVCSPARHMS